MAMVTESWWMALVSAGRLVKALQTEKETGQRTNELCDLSEALQLFSILNTRDRVHRFLKEQVPASTPSFPKSMISKTSAA